MHRLAEGGGRPPERRRRSVDSRRGRQELARRRAGGGRVVRRGLRMAVLVGGRRLVARVAVRRLLPVHVLRRRLRGEGRRRRRHLLLLLLRKPGPERARRRDGRRVKLLGQGRVEMPRGEARLPVGGRRPLALVVRRPLPTLAVGRHPWGGTRGGGREARVRGGPRRLVREGAGRRELAARREGHTPVGQLAGAGLHRLRSPPELPTRGLRCSVAPPLNLRLRLPIEAPLPRVGAGVEVGRRPVRTVAPVHQRRLRALALKVALLRAAVAHGRVAKGRRGLGCQGRCALGASNPNGPRTVRRGAVGVGRPSARQTPSAASGGGTKRTEIITVLLIPCSPYAPPPAARGPLLPAQPQVEKLGAPRVVRLAALPPLHLGQQVLVRVAAIPVAGDVARPRVPDRALVLVADLHRAQRRHARVLAVLERGRAHAVAAAAPLRRRADPRRPRHRAGDLDHALVRRLAAVVRIVPVPLHLLQDVVGHLLRRLHEDRVARRVHHKLERPEAADQRRRGRRDLRGERRAQLLVNVGVLRAGRRGDERLNTQQKRRNAAREERGQEPPRGDALASRLRVWSHDATDALEVEDAEQVGALRARHQARVRADLARRRVGPDESQRVRVAEKVVLVLGVEHPPRPHCSGEVQDIKTGQ
eukprot:3851183-Prymnesium_polylepis.1